MKNFRETYGGRMFCFSPQVMLATFIIEIFGALFILLRYHLDQTAKLMVAMLLFLGLFQAAEYMVCEGAFGLSSLDWARIGYVAITLLPPLGIHLVLSVAGRKIRYLLPTVYALAGCFALFFLLVGHGMQGEQCLGNYVIFRIARYAVWPYAVYYYGLLLVAVYIAYINWQSTRVDATRRALQWLAAGYAAFILPTTFVNIISPETIAGIPSIMCGFAVLLSIVLIFAVAPLVLKKRVHGKKP